MKTRVIAFLLLGSLVSGCILRPNRPLSNDLTVPTSLLAETATPVPPTETPVPTATATVLPTPDFSVVGLPVEDAGNLAFDFVSQMCNAQWFTEGGQLPCPGNDTQESAGYVMSLNGEIQGLPSNLNMLLTFPPTDHYQTLFGKYPSFTIKAGDRFRAVLACRAHTFCDVEFGLEYYDEQGKTGLKHWSYLFADPPIVIDYPLDGIAGMTVQLGLSIKANGNPSGADAVWIVPHIYRPTP